MLPQGTPKSCTTHPANNVLYFFK